MKLNPKSEGIKIKGHRGAWYVVHSSTVRDMNGKEKVVYALEHETYGEDANPLFVTSEGVILGQFEGYLMLEDIVYDMINNEWD